MITKFNLKKCLATILVFTFCFTLLPVNLITAKAEEAANVTEEINVTEAVEETEEKTDEEVGDVIQENSKDDLSEESEGVENEEATTFTETETTTVQILATTDLHGRFTNYEYARDLKSDGGLTQISTLIKQNRNENTIVIDNGDTTQGNYNHLFLNDETQPMILGLNEIGYDVFNLGNHEFNFGMDKLNNFIEQTNENLQVLCANVYKDGNRVFNPYTIKTLENGVKVAIIGVVSPWITKWDAANLVGYEAKSPAEEVTKVIGEIKENGGADLYIVSAHVGLNSEYGRGDSATEIAQANNEVSAIIMGHSHEKKSGITVGNAVVVQPGNNGADLGKIEITLEKSEDGYKVIGSTSSTISTKGVEVDRDLEEKLEEYHERAIADARSVIGTLDKSLANNNEVKGIPQSLVEDQGVTDLVNEVQLYYSAKYLESLGIDQESGYHISGAALFDADSNMLAGDITKAAVSNIYKYDNKLYVIKTNGKQLKRYMEWTSSIYNQFKTGDLTVSLNEDIRLYQYDMFDGIKYEINISKPAGSRIENVYFEKDGKEVADDDIVYLAVNNYRYDSILNAAGNPVFEPGTHEKIYDTNSDNISDMRDLIIDYIINVKDGQITRNVDNNWQLTGVNYDKDLRSKAVKLVNDGILTLPTSEDGRTPNVRSLTWNDVLEALDTTRVEIMSFNDLHGNVEEIGKNIGVAKLATLLKERKLLSNTNYEAFAVAAGDLYQGTAISNLTYGKPVSEFLSEVGIEASALGNHEFDWGLDKIEKWSEEGNFPFLAANLVDKATGNPVDFAEPYKIIESNGIKIGLIGITTEETAYKTKPENVKDVTFLAPLEVVNKYAKELKEEKDVDVVVVLSHLGATQDRETGEITGEAADLAKKAVNVDAIIAAHDHQFTSGKVNNVAIVESGYNGRGLSILTFDFDKDGNLLSVTPNTEEVYKRAENIVPDEKVAALVEANKEALAPILEEKVTVLDKDLEYNSREGLQPLGIVVAETMRVLADADICITNGGGIRAPLSAGDITVGDMYTILPFDNTLFTMELKGEDIVKALEHGIMPDNMGWGQFSGVKVWYDEDAEAGSRITSVRLADGTKLDMNEYYKVVVNDFMATGGDGYDFANAKEMNDTNIVMRDGIMEYWRENGINTDIEELLVSGEDQTIDINPENPEEKPEEVKPENKPGDSTKPGKGELPNTGGVNSVYPILIGLLVAGSGFGVIKKKKENDIA